ncbi:hypothetical protein EHS25_000721 [Saitozyma podzolica]|uniref:Uncharacterized protein n=1 Tax=Saitozyma podzolica TaxID=1890683 RepID=A0A427YWZ7_9TREE|nr:hypothetical protein EHS25_000721 [Saitozyma podzolica]
MAILTKRNLAHAALALGLDVTTGGVVVYTRGAAEVLAVAKTAAVSSKSAALVAAKGAVVGTGLAVKGFVITDIIQQVDILMGGLVHRRVDWPAFIRRSITRFVKAVAGVCAAVAFAFIYEPEGQAARRIEVVDHVDEGWGM